MANHAVTAKKVWLLIILVILCFILFSQTAYPVVSVAENRHSVSKQSDGIIDGKSPEGLPIKSVKPTSVIISPSILAESENTETGLMLDGSDVAVIPALASTDVATFKIKLFMSQNSTLFSLKTNLGQNYIVLGQTAGMLWLKLCLSENANIPNVSREFEYKFINSLKRDWVRVTLAISRNLITLGVGADVFKEARHPKDTLLPSEMRFHTLTIGGEGNDDDALSACKITDLDFFGTKFGKFIGTHPAIFPLNLRKHLTVYPIDISFSLEPAGEGTLLVIYENDKNYLKVYLQDSLLKIMLKSKGRKYFHTFKHILELNKTVSVKLLFDNYITVNFLYMKDSHSTITKEQSTATNLEDTDIYWLSAAHRIFLGGVPHFPKENFKGSLYNVSFQDVTSLF